MSTIINPPHGSSYPSHPTSVASTSPSERLSPHTQNRATSGSVLYPHVHNIPNQVSLSPHLQIYIVSLESRWSGHFGDASTSHPRSKIILLHHSVLPKWPQLSAQSRYRSQNPFDRPRASFALFSGFSACRLYHPYSSIL